MSNPYKVAFWVLLSLVLVPAGLFVGCAAILGESEPDELRRVPSPGGAVDAVLTQVVGSGGAVANVNKELRLVPNGGEDYQGTNLVLKMDRLYDLDELELRWRNEALLEVRYPAAVRITSFSNYVSLNSEQGERYTVEVRLVPK